MLLGTAHELATGDHNATVHNALLESFTVHLRAAMDFLWPPERLHPDDVVANDFFSDPKRWDEVRPQVPEILNSVKLRTGKEVAHLSYSRLTVDPGSRQWHSLDMASAAAVAFQVFVDNAERTKVGNLVTDP